MKLQILSQKVLCENPDSIHSYSGWPTVTRLKNGRLAAAFSGLRLYHVCPFGKCMLSFSDDEGESWSLPAPVIDTPLDDRDGGITPFGESSVIVTSFNNTPAMQRGRAKDKPQNVQNYIHAYLDLVEEEGSWPQYLGSTYRISHDNGVTFGPLHRIPVTCPHGPLALRDGSLLYVGRKFSENDAFGEGQTYLSVYRLSGTDEDEAEFLCEIKNVPGELSCEPHAIELEDGTILVHIRMNREFTIYQCESYDGGHSFTAPHRLLPPHGGSPAHLLQYGDRLLSVYGYREKPYGLRFMISSDQGKTWDTDHILLDDAPSQDVGYPSSVLLKDGTILTVYYTRMEENGPAVIRGVKWKPEL